MVASSDDEYFVDLHMQFTGLIRLARDPRLIERMGAGNGDSRLFVLLNLLYDRGPSRASDLLDFLTVDQSTLSRQLATLVERGFVERHSDPTDGRAARIVLTPLGTKTIEGTRGAWQDTLAGLMADWSDADRSSLLDLLTRLATALASAIIEPPERAAASTTV